jgi:hypothetical protein
MMECTSEVMLQPALKAQGLGVELDGQRVGDLSFQAERGEVMILPHLNRHGFRRHRR